MTKICTKCGECKEMPEFHKNRASRDGFMARCKVCINTAQKAYRRTAEYKTKRAAYRRSVGSREADRAYRASAKGKVVRRAYRQSETGKAKKLAYRQSAKHRAFLRAYWQSGRYRALKRAQHLRRRERDPAYRLKNAVKNAVGRVIKAAGGSNNRSSTFACLPYSPRELCDHLESLWEPWMNWSNYGFGAGKWCIDHIIPHSAFYYTAITDAAFRECWALSNLRPLGIVENLHKGARLELAGGKEGQR